MSEVAHCCPFEAADFLSFETSLTKAINIDTTVYICTCMYTEAIYPDMLLSIKPLNS